ncbi:hypothetical protein F4778DRAFT_781442 [Xylariomycetidae sp. FL2044]|nr:hypothetical protein F4778DRAFT_781442 [Xylariomycetidae sp. FL2044]
MSTKELGPLVRLWGIRTAQLPAPTEEADELAPFLISLLQEAVPFIDSAAPKKKKKNPADGRKLWKPKGSRTHADSAAPVEVSERTIPAAALRPFAAGTGTGTGDSRPSGEYWACRRSVHEDAARTGTASWAEFDRCFRADHAASERAFTPNVLDAREALRWRGAAAVEAREGGRVWRDFGLAVVEMRHKVGRPLLKDRTFPVLQMTCSAAAVESSGGGEGEGEGEEGKEFLVVSVPVPDFADAEASQLAREKGAQVAFYASVERVRKLPPGREGEGEGEGGRIEWLMATASDAAGVLPGWVQNLAMPGVIWKDVPLFLGWIARERGKGKGEGEGGKGGTE